jgi:hypothetical protein
MKFISTLEINNYQFISSMFFNQKLEIDFLFLDDVDIFFDDDFNYQKVRGDFKTSEITNEKIIEDFCYKKNRNSFPKIRRYDLYYDFFIEKFLDDLNINPNVFNELYLKSPKYSYLYITTVNKKEISNDLKNKLEDTILIGLDESFSYLKKLDFDWPKFDEYISKMEDLEVINKYLEKIYEEIQKNLVSAGSTKIYKMINDNFSKSINSIKDDIHYVRYLCLFPPSRDITSKILKLDDQNIKDPDNYIKHYLYTIMTDYIEEEIDVTDLFLDFKDIFPMLEKRSSLYYSELMHFMNILSIRLTDPGYLNIIKKYKNLYFCFNFAKLKNSNKTVEEVFNNIKIEFPENYQQILNNDQLFGYIISTFHKELDKPVIISFIEEDIIKMSSYPESMLLIYLYFYKERLSKKSEEILLDNQAYKNFLNKPNSFFNEYSSIYTYSWMIGKGDNLLEDPPDFLDFEDEDY